MKINVANGRVLGRLTWRSLKANRLRNVIAVFAIALTTILFTTLFTLGIGTLETFQNATMRQAGGKSHASIKYITDADFDRIKGHGLIREIAYQRVLCDGLNNEGLLKRHTELNYMDDAGLRQWFCEPMSGHRPVKENEVIADTKTLMLLGVPEKVGAPVSLRVNIRGREVIRDFILSGWWESDPVMNAGFLFTSRAYVDTHMDELQNTYDKDHHFTGVVNAHIMFRNGVDIEGKLKTVLKDCGYSEDPSSPDYVESGVNWAYLGARTSGMDTESLIALPAAFLLIVFTGYLIIYNIFHISVIRDIQFYGLLKTIGTTGRQIRRIIRRQALFLSAAGIPGGLLAGFLIGKAFVPMIINRSSYAGSIVSVSPSPWIFIGSALFALITVLISVFKPGRAAAAVSPVEAVRYSDAEGKGRSGWKKTKGGAKTYRMAFSNLGRNKKRTVLVIISLSLSLVLLNTVYTLSQGIDMNKFLGKSVDTDFLIAHAKYFQDDFTGRENELTESFIQAVESRPGFEGGGRLYGGRTELFTAEDKNSDAMNLDQYGNAYSAVYGLEDLPMERLKLIDGELGREKLASGKYILEGIYLDDYGVPEMDSAHYAVGDTVTLHNYRGTSENFKDREYTSQQFEVLGHVAVKSYNSDRTRWGYVFYLPADIYRPLLSDPVVMSYIFNVEDDYEAEMERFLKNYTDRVEPLMNYSSKMTYMNEFEGLKNTVVMIGGALSIITGMVGILNFINAVLTGILTRRREFAMLQGIGMTRRQLRAMLCFEGTGYFLGTCLLSLSFGSAFSLLIVREVASQLWFFSYRFLLWPLLLVLPVLFLLGVAIPAISYAATDRKSIVERLRAVE